MGSAVMLYYGINQVKEGNNNSNDNNKALFDPVAHDWISKCIDIYKISPTFIQFLTTNNYGPLENNPYLKTTHKGRFIEGNSASMAAYFKATLSLSPSLLSSLGNTCSTVLSFQQHQLW